MTGRPDRRSRRDALTRGLVAGVLAGLVMTALMLLLRTVAGVPLPVELGSDRFIPLLDVHTFTRLLGRLGGPLQAKQKAFVGGFLLQLVAAAAGGALLGLAFGAMTSARARRALAAGALALAWAAAAALLWPALASNDRGLPPGWAALATAFALLLAFETYAVVLVVAWERWSSPHHSPRQPGPALGRSTTRRAVLTGGAGVALAIVSGGLSWLLYRRATFGVNGYDGLQVRGPRTAPITPAEDFYVVTKNMVDPDVDEGLWRLEVTGLVDSPRHYSLMDLRGMPPVRQEQTLECISNRVGSGLMSNAVWTGVPLATLVDRAGPKPGVRRVALHAADGYVHTISLDQAMAPTTLVAVAMNGHPLPGRHGFPARVLVPGTYGEVNVKWVDRVDLTADDVEGYYERQGWRPYFVNTTSRFDRPTPGQALPVEAPVSLGGVAFAGDRGISMVEWSADDGSTWHPGRLTYSPSPLAWTLWEGTWTPAAAGPTTLAVRATDGRGGLQTDRPHGAVPAGATGLHMVRVTVR